MSSSDSEAGGYKGCNTRKGDHVYSKLKFEGGTHRVQEFLQQSLKEEFTHLLLQLLLCQRLMMLKLRLTKAI